MEEKAKLAKLRFQEKSKESRLDSRLQTEEVNSGVLAILLLPVRQSIHQDFSKGIIFRIFSKF